MTELHIPSRPLRFVTAASLFDGHDASINIIRRILQRQGGEVIHLGHNRSVDEVVTAAVQEDVDGIAVSSYQGGHLEYFRYLIDRLRAADRRSIRVYAGGGGVIIPQEIAELERYGVSRVFSPADGQRLGLAGMVNTMIAECDVARAPDDFSSLDGVLAGDQRALARFITLVEMGMAPPGMLEIIRARAQNSCAPVIGITGTGGSGKSSLTDELLLRLRIDHDDKVRVAVLAVDPTRQRAGALLGDRIRMNSIHPEVVYFRSIATRGSSREVPDCLDDVIAVCKVAGYDVVMVETPGIGQGDAAIVPLSDISLYVMTPEFGAASQLEKIEMLELADVIAINKFDRNGAADALRDVRRQVARNHERFDVPPDELPVFGAIASRFNDPGITALYQHIVATPMMNGVAATGGRLTELARLTSSTPDVIVPPARRRYLSEVAEAVRRYHDETHRLGRAAHRVQGLSETMADLETSGADSSVLEPMLESARRDLDPHSVSLLSDWSELAASYRSDRSDGVRTMTETLAGTRVPRVAVPRYEDHGDLLRWLRSENVPGRFPFTAGVFPFKRENEDPTRMFAGEGGPARTNRRFHLLAAGQRTTRLSTAFDSVTLYGFDPDEQPDIYGKVGNSGVSVATLDDMKTLFDGFDLASETTSVSMTINGPAPALLAMYFNAAIEQHPELEPAEVLHKLRGTVQADILKEDQGQNTCIFSTEFALRMMADVQEWFVSNHVQNFYSVSISGYHIAEAGANPISQLAFTLANAFTYVESYLARGMDIDDFAPNLSFFFSNGMDPEYTVIGRVARRIWAIAMRDRYGANERSQKLKYHIQTSGRSLHAQEISFNDIRTTLQALCAVYDNCNSLHTNAYDEAITTPAEESVRRALAIQLIINREWGLAANENPLQGSFIVEEMTALVEDAVLAEFEQISERGGVLGAMEFGYQRSRIQEESMLYEQRKHDGTIPIVGVNTFLAPEGHLDNEPVALARSSEAEKRDQLSRLSVFKDRNRERSEVALERLRATAFDGGNLFGELLQTVRTCTLGEITGTLFEVGGKYRRNM